MNDAGLALGSRVFVQNRAVVSRNKIQDHWDSVPPTLLHNPILMDPTQWNPWRGKVLKSREILEARDLVVDIHQGDAQPSNTVSQTAGDKPVRRQPKRSPRLTSEGSAESDSEGEDRVLICSQLRTRDTGHTGSAARPREGQCRAVGAVRQDQVGGPVPDRTGEPLEPPAPYIQVGVRGADTDRTGEQLGLSMAATPVVWPVPLPRRSARNTAGQHANPHHLPKSSQAEEAQVDVLGAGSSILAQMAQTQLLIAQMMATAGQ